MVLIRKIGRRTAAAGLATALVGGALLATGAAGSLAHELRPGASAAAQPAESGSSAGIGQPAAGRTPSDMTAARLAKKQARATDPTMVALQAQVRTGARVNWNAVSPWTHLGDHYSLVLTNGPTPQKVIVHAMIMDHRNQVNTVVLHEELPLTAGEQRELSVTNEYGDANHFSTRIGGETDSLAFQVTLSDSAGAETARFNQRSFNFVSRPVGGPRALDKQVRHTHGP
jgi:hypothetical protein